MFIQLEIWRPENGIANNFFPSFSQLDTNNAIFSNAYKEENVGIYHWYIVYRETLTRYFVEKNRRGEKSLKIDKKSSIYRHQAINRRFNEKKTTKKEENHRNIGNFSFGQHVAVLCYSALSKMPLFCAVEGIWTPNKRFGVQLIRAPRQAWPLLNVLHLKYIFKIII